MREIAGTLVAGRRDLELLDTPLAVSLLDQRLAKRLMRFRIVGVVGNARLELVNARCRRRFLDVREHERARLVAAAADFVDPQVDKPGPPSAGGDRGGGLGLVK